ncbi:MAG: hypothetical protein WCO53_07910 [Deltaproteobacteria bacterium]
MKICRRCQRDYEHDFSEVTSPAQELGDLFLENSTAVEEDGLCPECKEEKGILFLLGFGQ